MSTIMDLLMAQMGDANLDKVSRTLGTDQSTTHAALEAALPLVVAALAGNARRPDGAQDLYQALERDHDGQRLDHASDYLTHPDFEDGAGILRHALGDRRAMVERGLASQTGLTGTQVSRLLELAAPLVMAYLGKRQRDEGLDANSLTTMLAQQRQAAESSAPDALGGLLRVLANSGGTDDLGRALASLLGR